MVLVGLPTDLERLLADEPELRFEAILGRNALVDIREKAAAAASLAQRLAPGGTVSLAEGVPRQTQRLHELVSLDELGSELGHRVVEAEEAIYQRDDDPLVSWDSGDLVEAWRSTGLDVEFEVRQLSRDVQVTPDVLGRWFGPGGVGRPSYAQHLGELLSIDEIDRVESIYRRGLLGRTCGWRSAVVYLRAR
jgi:putative ATPase